MSMVLSSSAVTARPSTAQSFAVSLMTVMADGWHALVARLEAAGSAHEPRTAEELIEWAHAYEATQPSYAADLHAAALRAQEMAMGTSA